MRRPRDRRHSWNAGIQSARRTFASETDAAYELLGLACHVARITSAQQMKELDALDAWAPSEPLCDANVKFVILFDAAVAGLPPDARNLGEPSDVSRIASSSLQR